MRKLKKYSYTTNLQKILSKLSEYFGTSKCTEASAGNVYAEILIFSFVQTQPWDEFIIHQRRLLLHAYLDTNSYPFPKYLHEFRLRLSRERERVLRGSREALLSSWRSQKNIKMLVLTVSAPPPFCCFFWGNNSNICHFLSKSRPNKIRNKKKISRPIRWVWML